MNTYFTALYSLHKCLDAVLALITVASKTSVPGSSRFQGTGLKFLCRARTVFSRQVSVPINRCLSLKCRAGRVKDVAGWP